MEIPRVVPQRRLMRTQTAPFFILILSRAKAIRRQFERECRPILPMITPTPAILITISVLWLGVCTSVQAACLPPPANLVSWWQAEGDATDDASTNNGTLQGGVSYAPGMVGQAFSFDGASGYIQVADSRGLDFGPTSPITIELWAYWNGTSLNNGMAFVTKRIDCGTSWNYEMAMDSTYGLQFNGAPDSGLLTGVLMPSHTWTHLAGTFDGGTYRFYTNGVLIGTASGSLGPANSSPLTIGAVSGCSFFPGLLDEVSIYNTALSASEISAIYNAGSAGKCPLPMPPTITNQPMNQFVTVGQTASFLVSAAGSRPLSYVWRLNGDSVSGATNSALTIQSVQFTNAGTYSVMISNAYGSTVSSNAMLTVRAPITRYVNINNPSPFAPYSTWPTAATNIQNAVDSALAGDSILVTNGLYLGTTGTNAVTATNGVIIQSVNGATATLIDGGGAMRCAYLANGTSLAGFTVTNGFSSGDGGGLWCDSPGIVVSNCVLTGNTSSNNGGGVLGGTLNNCTLTDNSAPGSSVVGGGGAFGATLNNCILTHNSAQNNGGAATACTLNYCTVTENQAGWGGGVADGTINFCTLSGNSSITFGGGAYGIYYCTLNSCSLLNNTSGAGGGAAFATLNNCLLFGNVAQSPSGGSYAAPGGGEYFSDLNNCTVSGNLSATDGGGAYGGNFYNSIILYNQSPTEPNYAVGTDYPNSAINFCCTTPLPWRGVGNISADPQFTDLAHICATSPCRGAGSAAYTQGADIDGQAWLSPASIGCDEYYAGSVTGALSVAISVPYTNIAAGFSLGLNALIGGHASLSTWDFGDGITVSNAPFTSYAWGASGIYSVVLRAYNDGNPAGVSATVDIQVVPAPTNYVVTANTLANAPYSSWSTAATNIQDAINAAAVPGTLVLVSNGLYQAGGLVVNGETDLVAVAAFPLTVQSVNGPAATLINGNGTVRCAYLTNGAMLTGFTLTNGATGGNGGGVWCTPTGVTVSNCIITGCSAGYSGGGAFQGAFYNCAFVTNSAAYSGGGVWLGSLTNCTLTNNSAGNGGGVYESVVNRSTLNHNSAATYGGGMDSSGLNNCLVLNNLAEYGGGSSAGLLNNCTVTGNSASTAGGGSSGSALNNCIVYYNTASSGTNFDSYCTLAYCCSTPFPSAAGNFTSAPQFVNLGAANFRLQTNSPCINTGNNAYVMGTTDLDGRPRIVGGTVDVGAYEFQGPGIGEFIAWLQQYGLLTDGSADYVDSDGDGMNNWQEWIAGTNPTNAVSVLEFSRISLVSGGVSLLWTNTTTGRSYFVQRSTSPAAPFAPVATNLTGVSGSMSYADTNAPARGPAFYRVGVHLQ
jgi:Concanavalin A-like lectin/glucanases superfamily/Immunoglobulin domain